MSKSAEVEAKEDLAQLGIKKGSRVWPILGAIIAAALIILYLPHKTPLKDRFIQGCLDSNGRVLVSGILPSELTKQRLETLAEQSKNLPETKQLKRKLKQLGELQQLTSRQLELAARCLEDRKTAEQRNLFEDKLDEDFNKSPNDKSNDVFRDVGLLAKAEVYKLLVYETRDGSLQDNNPLAGDVNTHPQYLRDKTDQEAVKKLMDDGAWLRVAHSASPLVADGIRYLIRDFYFDFSGRLAELALVILVVALISVIPGVIGMIYRRNFWSWFIVPFGFFLLMSLWGQFGGDVTTGSVMILVLAQAFLLLLLLRLRRYSNSDSQLSYGTYNYILGAALIAVAAHWVLSPLASLPLEWIWDADVWPLGWNGRVAFVVLVLPAIYTLFKRSRAWRGATPKNIVVCLDGTTNTPDQMEGGRLAQTNVFKLFKMLKSDAPSKEAQSTNYNASISKRYGDKQLGLYYSGVGNKFEYNPIVQMLGGAGGLGAADVVDRAYLDVMRVYRPGDRVYIVGFSRGAAIARLLARALDQRGSPRTVWTLRLFGRHWTIWTSKRDKSKDLEIPVTVLGCWDTVGAFGIAKNIAGIDFQKLDLFKDLTVPDNVEQAYHMVALDEEREEFQPTLMDPDPLAPTRIVEVWFSGDHANIGGGWATTKLSDLTLDFLLRKVSSGYAHAAGMVPGDESWGVYLSGVNGEAVAPAEDTDKPYVDVDGEQPFVLHPDVLGQLRKWSSALYVYKPRELPNHAIISQSVFDRMVQAKPLYAPQSLFNLHDNLTEKRQSVNNAVDRLRETDSLKPDEHQTILEFKDRLQLTRWEEYFAELKQLQGPDQQHYWKEPSERLSNQVKADPVEA